MDTADQTVADGSCDPRASFTVLYRTFYHDVRRYVGWRCAASDVDDVVADVFTVAWRRFDEINNEMGRPWLFGVAKKVLSDHRRAISRRARFVDHLVSLQPAEYTSLDGGYLGVEDLEAVRAGLARMSTEDQELLVLSAWYQMTVGEISVALEITNGNARVRLFRARTRFRTAIAETKRGRS